jgi:hypothetical protein
MFILKFTFKSRPTIRRPPASAFEERYLAPTFTGDPMSIQFFAASSSAYTRKFRFLNGIKRMDWAPHYLDMNLIESVWSIWKARFRKLFRDTNKRPHGRGEIIAAAQAIWEDLPWRSIYEWIDKMPRRIATLLGHNRGSTRW